MAITGLTLGGNVVTPGSIDESVETEVVLGGSYANLSEDVLTSDDTNPVVNITGDTVDTDTFGTYTVTYTATDDAGDGDTVFTEIVTITADGNVDTNFDAGNETRSGADISGSVYDAVVDAAIGGSTPSTKYSAYFDEGALDPYEVKHSQA